MSETWKDTKFQLSHEWYDLTHYPRWWLLISGNRLLITGAVLVVVFIGLWGTVVSGLVPLREQTATLYLLFALISGNFTLITIAVSLSQLILTRHLESPGDIHEEITNMRAYREDVRETTHQSMTPVRPSGFFLLLFRSVHQDVHSLEEREWEIEDEQVKRDLDELITELNDHTTAVIDLLAESEAGLVFALFTTLSADYARYTDTIWYIQSEYGEELPESTNETIERIVDTIEHIDVARRIFKTTFIQSELTSLSRRLLYIGLPVLVGAIFLMLLFTAPAQTSISTAVLSVAIPVVVTAGLAPIVVLAVSILRLATLTGRDTAIYSFSSSFSG
jgi:heme A synthase